jgi:hypothetical protein
MLVSHNMTGESSDNAGHEVELKFENQANFQLKFIPIESAAVIIQKIRALGSLLDISVSTRSEANIIDEYYDTDQMALQSAGCSLRCRSENAHQRVTLKSHKQFSEARGLHRAEYECDFDKDRFKELSREPKQVEDLFRQEMDLSLSLSGRPLQFVLAVHNQRTTVKLSTSVAEYLFSYDKLYYFQSGRYSEYFAEIEVEHTSEDGPPDPQITKLREGITKLLGYAPNTKSKLQRGLEWSSKGPEDIRHVYSVAFDIVKFSPRPADQQKQLIQTLNLHTKKAIRQLRGVSAEQSTVYLPTGDGMILVFEDQPDTIVPVVREVQRYVKEHNSASASHKFEFRAGIHSGTVFKYSDVNENPNFAGDGINLVQRVMSLGDGWHVLATGEGFEATGKVSTNLQTLFKPIGMYPIKHGPTIDVFNVYDRDLDFGNPITPKKP